MNFALRGTKDPFTGKELGFSRSELLSAYTDGRKSGLSRYGSEDSLCKFIFKLIKKNRYSVKG